MVNYKKILKTAAIVGGVGGILVLAGCQKTPNYTQEQLDKAVSEAKDLSFQEGVNSVDVTLDNAQAIADAKAEWEAPEVSVYTTADAVLEECDPYTIDDLGLGDSVAVVLDDSDFCRLKEGSIEFDDKDYDYKETVELSSDVKVAYSGSPQFDHELEEQIALITSKRGAVEYKYKFDDAFPWNKVDSDMPLELDFLGQSLRLVNADDATNELVVENGHKVFMKAGESSEGLKLLAVGDNSVLVEYEGQPYSINDGSSKSLGEVKVRAEVFKEGESALITIGENAGRTVQDGDAYFGQDKDDPEWVWSIDLVNNEIGVKHAKRLDNVEDAYKVGDSLKLPNDFMEVKFVKLSSDVSSDYSMEFDTIDIADVPTKAVMLQGDFKYGVSSYSASELAWANNKLYVYDSSSRDWNEVSNVFFKQNRMDLDAAPGSSDLMFDKVVLSVDFANEKFVALTYDGLDLSNRDSSLVTQSGFVIKDPKDNFEEGVLEIKAVPKETPEYGLVVKGIDVA